MSNNISINNNTNNSIHDLKQKYAILKDLRSNIVSLQDNICVKIQKLNNIYEELIKFNKQTLFVIGLDTFYFQKTLLNIEYDSHNMYFNMISNRIYCDYYKMYKIIQKFVSDNIKETKILDLFKTFSNYPVYDNLNIHKVYAFDTISNIFSDIVDILISMSEYNNNQNIVLKNYKIKQNYGLNINNFVFTLENTVNDFTNKLDLFNKYMHFFVSIHHKYFSKYLTRIKLMYLQINKDIKFDDNNISSKQTSDRIIDELSINNEISNDDINTISNDTDINDINKKNKNNINLTISKNNSVVNDKPKKELSQPNTIQDKSVDNKPIISDNNKKPNVNNNKINNIDKNTVINNVVNSDIKIIDNNKNIVINSVVNSDTKIIDNDKNIVINNVVNSDTKIIDNDKNTVINDEVNSGNNNIQNNYDIISEKEIINVINPIINDLDISQSNIKDIILTDNSINTYDNIRNENKTIDDSTIYENMNTDDSTIYENMNTDDSTIYENMNTDDNINTEIDLYNDDIKDNKNEMNNIEKNIINLINDYQENNKNNSSTEFYNMDLELEKSKNNDEIISISENNVNSKINIDDNSSINSEPLIKKPKRKYTRRKNIAK